MITLAHPFAIVVWSQFLMISSLPRGKLNNVTRFPTESFRRLGLCWNLHPGTMQPVTMSKFFELQLFMELKGCKTSLVNCCFCTEFCLRFCMQRFFKMPKILKLRNAIRFHGQLEMCINKWIFRCQDMVWCQKHSMGAFNSISSRVLRHCIPWH